MIENNDSEISKTNAPVLMHTSKTLWITYCIIRKREIMVILYFAHIWLFRRHTFFEAGIDLWKYEPWWTARTHGYNIILSLPLLWVILLAHDCLSQLHVIPLSWKQSYNLNHKKEWYFVWLIFSGHGEQNFRFYLTVW